MVNVDLDLPPLFGLLNPLLKFFVFVGLKILCIA